MSTITKPIALTVWHAKAPDAMCVYLRIFYHGVLLSYGQLGVSRRKRWFSY